MKLIHIIMLMLLLGLSTAQAREDFWYTGIGGGVAYLEDKDDVYDDSEASSNMFKAYVGYRASTYIAFEIDYSNLGSYDYNYLGHDDEASYETLSLSIVIMYPLIWDDFELYTPVGGSLLNVDYGVDDKTGYGYKVGFGVAYTPIKQFSIRLGTEYMILKYDSDERGNLQQNIKSVYGAIQYNF